MSQIYFIDQNENIHLTEQIKAEQDSLFQLLENPPKTEISPKKPDSGVYRAIRSITTRFSSSILPVVKAERGPDVRS